MAGDRCDVGIRLAADRRRACPEHHSGPLSSAAGDCPLAPASRHSPGRGQPQPDKTGRDIGARTLLVPMVDTAEQARREVVSATRYPPIGSRGAGVARAARWGRWRIIWRRRMTNSCLLIQVESRTALENLDAILEVDGIDGGVHRSGGSPPRWATRRCRHPDVQRHRAGASGAFARRGKRPDFWRLTRRWRKNVLAWGANFVAVRWMSRCIPGAGPPAGDV